MDYPDSKLPQIGTTIFTVMSQMATEYGAINLSQGFPDFDGPKALLEKVGEYVLQGANQYAPMTGLPALREAIAEKVKSHYGRAISAEDEVTVTSGATEAIFDAITTVVSPGDEVIIFDPAYDSYLPAVLLNGGIPVHLQLQPPQFAIDWDEVKSAITPKTRLMIFNSPHNPTGAVLSLEDLNNLMELVRGTDILLVGDEVYEHIVFDGYLHNSFVRFDELYQRSFTVSSFGKTYHATGWKVGYCVAPPLLSREFRKIHQFVTFAASTPVQHALADYMGQDPDHCHNLAGFYEHKRNLFCEAMEKSRFEFTPSGGTYFQIMDYSAIRDCKDVDFCEWLTTKKGVAAIPVSVFCSNSPPDMRLVRFCFAKNDDVLRKAAEQLVRL